MKWRQEMRERNFLEVRGDHHDWNRLLCTKCTTFVLQTTQFPSLRWVLRCTIRPRFWVSSSSIDPFLTDLAKHSALLRRWIISGRLVSHTTLDSSFMSIFFHQTFNIRKDEQLPFTLELLIFTFAHLFFTLSNPLLETFLLPLLWTPLLNVNQMNGHVKQT